MEIPLDPREEDRVARIDLDGSVADYDGEMRRRMAVPHHIEMRRKLIKNAPGFWRNLPRLEMGFEVVEELRAAGFRLDVLTKGPKTTNNAWTEKKEWCDVNLPDADVTVTQNKAHNYGRILMDDFPPYFLPWLKVRKRGFVIAVAQPHNEMIDHPRVLRYDGTNRTEMREKIRLVHDRMPGEDWLKPV